MTANNTMQIVEDILRLMDERPEVLEAVRARVLTRELLEMPERLTRLEATVADLVVTAREHTAILKEHTRRLDGIDTRLDGIDTRLDGKPRVNRTDGRFGSLRGRDLELNANDLMDDIAIEAGDYTVVEKLTVRDLYKMHREADTEGISNDDLKSFRVGDVIMRVEDGDGETCYIAVEASYTADDRDTDRASRNAKFLTRFTGHPALAVIASVHLDRRIEWIVESDEFFWYEMDEPH